MPPIQRCLAKAQTRLFYQRWLVASGWLACAALTAATLLVAANRILAVDLGTGVSVTRWGLLSLPGIVLTVALVVAAWRRPPAMAVAQLLDERLGLKDRLATALHFAARNDDPFARHVVQEAEDLSRRLRLWQALPTRAARPWAWAAVPAMALVLVALFLPGMDLARFRAGHRREQLRLNEAQRARERITAAAAVVSDLRRQPDTAQQDRAALAELESKLKELLERDLADAQTRRAAAAKLSELEERLADLAQRAERRADAVDNVLTRAATTMPGPADPLVDGLSRRDFDAARRALEELAKTARQMPPSDREAAARQLDELSRGLQDAARQLGEQKKQSRQSAEEALKDTGVPKEELEALRKLQAQAAGDQDSGPKGEEAAAKAQEAVRRALQDKGMEAQPAQDVARRLRDVAEQERQSDQAQRAVEDLAQALEEMSRCARAADRGSGERRPAPGQGSEGTTEQGKPGGQDELSRAAEKAAEQIDRLGSPRRSTEQLRESQSELAKVVRALTEGGGEGQTKPPRDTVATEHGTTDPRRDTGPHAGKGSGGDPLGAPRPMTGYRTQDQRVPSDGEGRVLSAYLDKPQGDGGKATPVVPYQQAVSQARDAAQRAVAEERVPRAYHQAIRRYFEQLPPSPQDIQKGAP